MNTQVPVRAVGALPTLNRLKTVLKKLLAAGYSGDGLSIFFTAKRFRSSDQRHEAWELLLQLPDLGVSLHRLDIEGLGLTMGAGSMMAYFQENAFGGQVNVRSLRGDPRFNFSDWQLVQQLVGAGHIVVIVRPANPMTAEKYVLLAQKLLTQ